MENNLYNVGIEELYIIMLHTQCYTHNHALPLH